MNKNIFFIGIGGKGLNGIAKICLEEGYKVSGVDVIKKPETRALEKSGAKIYYKHSKNNINSDIDLIVRTSITTNSPEIEKAADLNIPVIKRSSFLKELTKRDFRVCVAGSHGKSTTTALLGLGLINSGIDATIFGGAYTKEFNGYNHKGKTKYSIIEACEYDKSFYDLIGDITVITSMEKSHMEYYKNEDTMFSAFESFIKKHGSTAKIFINGDNHKLCEISNSAKCKIIKFGFEKHNDFIIYNVKKKKNGSTFSIKHKELVIKNINIYIPGSYNILNFASSIAVIHELGFSLEGILKTASDFTGVARRFEIHKLSSGQTVIDDFAHHPTQVKYLMDGVKQFYPNQKICAIFQPRQYNLMKNFIKEYGEAFCKADEIILTNILPALGDTKEDIMSISTHDLRKSIEQNSKKSVQIINDFDSIGKYVCNKYKKDSIILTIGAGDIYKVREKIK